MAEPDTIFTLTCRGSINNHRRYVLNKSVRKEHRPTKRTDKGGEKSKKKNKKDAAPKHGHGDVPGYDSPPVDEATDDDDDAGDMPSDGGAESVDEDEVAADRR